ncbi:VOC family protein [Stenotrophomonas maltophilia]|uniref:VOC family protein n=1 Tax=Stenotrophomonas maltophilia TaxID=40324 RepID=UPI0031B64FEA
MGDRPRPAGAAIVWRRWRRVRRPAGRTRGSERGSATCAHPSRVHLDIESDDIDAEADRLEKLGARRIGFVKRWWMMEAPTGHRFCIVPMRERDTPANHWP